jgi:hypothetical protein
MPLRRRWLTAIGSAIALSLCTAIPGHGDPAPDPSISPFPAVDTITAWYSKLPAEDFFIPNSSGVWFLSPTGLNCGIWTWGSFGCTGDIPGLPSGERHIAWFNGNRSVHHGWTAAMQFPGGQAQRLLPPGSYVNYATPGAGETTCAVTPEGNTYCAHGEFKFLTTPNGTWFKAWNDRDSYICNSYGTCPP